MSDVFTSSVTDALPAWPPQDDEILEALQRAFADGSWGKYHGDNGRTLVDRLAERHGVDHVLLTCSGTAAVELALRGLRVEPGDEVIVSAYDFEGNFKNVLLLGAKPVLVDIDSQTGQMDVTQLESARSPRTKVIIATHLHGGIVDMPTVRAFADLYGLRVIEDVCQMPGARVHGRMAGTWGDIGILSFGGSKLLSAGRGGAVVTRDADAAQRIRLHTQRGNDAYPLSELQAAVLLPQWKRLDERNRVRSANVDVLLDELADQPNLRSWVNRPASDAAAPSIPGFYKLGFWYEPAADGQQSRDDFVSAAKAAGIPLDTGFRALHRTHARGRFRAVNDLPVATFADDHVLVLHHPMLLADSDVVRHLAAQLKSVIVDSCRAT